MFYTHLLGMCESHPCNFPYIVTYAKALFELQLAVHTAYSSVIKSIPRPLECKFFFFRVGVTTVSFLYAANRVIYCFLLESMLICIRLTGDYILLNPLVRNV
jgi:hypothetical protein